MSLMEISTKLDLNRENYDELLDLNCENPSEVSDPQEYPCALGPEEVDISGIMNNAEIVDELPKNLMKQPADDQHSEEPEEGEISDDIEQVIGDHDEIVGIPCSLEKGESSSMQKKEFDPSSSKSSASGTFVRWPNGDAMKFYQLAWAQGVQGILKESAGDSPLADTASMKGKKGGDSDSPSAPLERSASWSGNKDMDHTKGGWIIGDHGMEYVNFLRSDDGYIYLQDGGERLGKGQGDKVISEKLSILENMGDKLEEKYRNSTEEQIFALNKECQRWSDGNMYSKESDKQSKRMKDWERRLEEQPFLQGNSNQRSDYGSSDQYCIMSDSLKDKCFTECRALLSNVTIKDAQKSFISVCKRLRRSLKILRDLNKRPGSQFQHPEGYQWKVFALTRDAFSGIRAAYAVVRSIDIGKEQEQNTDAFLRLLDLARNRCQSLFTSNQIQELDSLMMMVGSQNRNIGDYMLKPYMKGYENERAEDKDSMFLESSCNTSATTQLESDTSTDVSANCGDEAEQPPNQASEMHLSGEISANSAIHILDNTMAGNMGLGGWFSSGPEELNEDHSYVFAKEIGPSSIPTTNKMMDFQSDMNTNSLPHFIGGVIDTKKMNFPERETQVPAQRNHGFSSPMDPVKALSSYHERFAGKSRPEYTRLPSPTPEDEDEDATVKGKLETSATSVDSREAQGAGRQGESLQDFQQNFSTSGIPQPESLSNFEDSSGPLRVEDRESEMNQANLMLAKKSRDPRRRLGSQPMVLDLLQPAIKNEGYKNLSNGTLVSKQQDVLPKDDLVSLLSLRTGGGWLTEPELIPGTSGTSSMDIDNEVLQMTVESSNISSQRKRQFELLSQENPAKRHKSTEGTKESDELSLLQTTAFADDAKQLHMDENESLVRRPQSKLSESAVESPADSSKPKMKPRDPRRLLLGSSLGKFKSKEELPVRDNVASLPVMESNGIPQSKGEGATKMGSTADRKSVSYPNRTDISPALVEEKDLNIINNKPEDLLRVSKPIDIATKVPVNKVEVKVDTSTSMTAPKQREIINHWDNLEPLLEGLEEKQKQAVRQERARRIDEQSRMFAARKLCLVLDLDHTLLNSAKFAEIEEEWEAKLRANEIAERAKFAKEGNKRELYRFPHMGMWTKLRPGIWNFLARASQLYELHVYTMGNKAYATEMAKLLDPTGVLFAGRVISKGDDGDVVDGDDRPPKSKDLDGVLGMESAVVIIDDSVRVWPHHRHNLIVVERYMYFPCSRKQFGLPGPSLLEVGHDEREQDGMLASALMVIEKIHYNFFSNPRLYEVDVRDILAKEQRKVLMGCKLIFSRVFPQGEIQPHLHPLWQLAEQFGAVCSMAIDESVTHVVAISLGTDKVNWGLTTGRFVVRPAWLEASAILYRRANERDFLVLP